MQFAPYMRSRAAASLPFIAAKRRIDAVQCRISVGEGGGDFTRMLLSPRIKQLEDGFLDGGRVCGVVALLFLGRGYKVGGGSDQVCRGGPSVDGLDVGGELGIVFAGGVLAWRLGDFPMPLAVGKLQSGFVVAGRHELDGRVGRFVRIFYRVQQEGSKGGADQGVVVVMTGLEGKWEACSVGFKIKGHQAGGCGLCADVVIGKEVEL